MSSVVWHYLHLRTPPETREEHLKIQYEVWKLVKEEAERMMDEYSSDGGPLSV